MPRGTLLLSLATSTPDSPTIQAPMQLLFTFQISPGMVDRFAPIMSYVDIPWSPPPRCVMCPSGQ